MKTLLLSFSIMIFISGAARSEIIVQANCPDSVNDSLPLNRFAVTLSEEKKFCPQGVIEKSHESKMNLMTESLRYFDRVEVLQSECALEQSRAEKLSCVRNGLSRVNIQQQQVQQHPQQPPQKQADEAFLELDRVQRIDGGCYETISQLLEDKFNVQCTDVLLFGVSSDT